MVYLAIIYHMHQPYYKNLLTGEIEAPWVRLHGIKDYMDMLLILKNYPLVHATFNVVPCLLEQIEDYAQGESVDKYLALSYKPARELTIDEKSFIKERFFSIYPEYGIAVHPRYYQLYFKKDSGYGFSTQDFLDLQVWFNLAWFDPYYRKTIPDLKRLVLKGRFFTEGEKRICLKIQIDILKQIIPAYKEFQDNNQIEIITNPYYHPILPLLYNSEIAKEANPKAEMLKENFNFPQDAQQQINSAVQFYQSRFNRKPGGMWPSEESVSEDILDLVIKSGINWIVTDEDMLFKSLGKKRRTTAYLYQPYHLQRNNSAVDIIFRDRNLSDLIGFIYHSWKAEDAVKDFMGHLKEIDKYFGNKNALVVVALDGENAWEYYKNDGWDFLSCLYHGLSKSDFIKTTTVSEYLKNFPPKRNISYLKSGSWVRGDFNKWIGSNPKNIAWQYLLQARKDLQEMIDNNHPIESIAWKQLYIIEGSDWFWWYGDTDDTAFDEMFRMHLINLYRILNKEIPAYLNKPISA